MNTEDVYIIFTFGLIVWAKADFDSSTVTTTLFLHWI